MERGGYVYIMSNKNRTVLYIGVTSSLYWRVMEHKSGNGSIFTQKYNCYDLLYYQSFSRIEEAIQREKNIKKWKREWKMNTIKTINPTLRDLSEEVRHLI